ncbi:MAG: hypothetical protein Q9226_006688, partial [Calogaya cf. arnoldii]
LPPGDDTVYYMASLTKAITCAAMAALVDKGQVKWDTPVSQILPDFAQRKDAVGRDVTILDILAHRTRLASANALWAQRNQIIPMSKSETLRTCVHLQSVSPLGEQFFYHNWGYGLATEIIEKVSGLDFGTFARKSIFEPLSMKHTTIDVPDDGLLAHCYMARDDGTPCLIPPPPQTNKMALAGAGGCKSSIGDLLVFYRALMLASHLDRKDSPIKQVAMLFKAQITIGQSSIEDEAYALGWERTTHGLNHEKTPVTGNNSAARTIMYHHGTLVGFLSSVFLIPDSETAVIVMTNSHPFADSSDWGGQLVLETILEGEPSHDFIQLTEDTKAAQFAAYSDLADELGAKKSRNQPTRALEDYCGVYYIEAGNLHLDIVVQGDKLLMIVQGLREVQYVLEPYDDDTFWWPVNREYEQCDQCMFSWTWSGVHLVSFLNSHGSISALEWHHDVTTPSAERFVKKGVLNQETESGGTGQAGMSEKPE